MSWILAEFRMRLLKVARPLGMGAPTWAERPPEFRSDLQGSGTHHQGRRFSLASGTL